MMAVTSPKLIRLAVVGESGPLGNEMAASPRRACHPHGASIGGGISPLAVTRPDGFAFDDEGRLVIRTRRGLLTMCRNAEPQPVGS